MGLSAKQVAAIVASIIAVAAVSRYHDQWRKYFSAVEKFQGSPGPFGPGVSPQVVGLIFMAIAFVVASAILIWSRWMATPKAGVLGNMSNVHPMNPPYEGTPPNNGRNRSNSENSGGNRNRSNSGNNGRNRSNSVANVGEGGNSARKNKN
jgi:hypothetical protein